MPLFDVGLDDILLINRYLSLTEETWTELIEYRFDAQKKLVSIENSTNINRLVWDRWSLAFCLWSISVGRWTVLLPTKSSSVSNVEVSSKIKSAIEEKENQTANLSQISVRLARLCRFISSPFQILSLMIIWSSSCACWLSFFFSSNEYLSKNGVPSIWFARRRDKYLRMAGWRRWMPSPSGVMASSRTRPARLHWTLNQP